MRDLIDRIEKAPQETQRKIAAYLHRSKKPAMRSPDEEKPSYLPFRNCDNCDLTSTEQDGGNPLILRNTCPNQKERYFDGEAKRMICSSWSQRLKREFYRCLKCKGIFFTHFPIRSCSQHKGLEKEDEEI